MKRIIKKLKLLTAEILGLFGFAMPLCKFKYGELMVTFSSNGWVFISDGDSEDALPINMVSQELVDAITHELGV